MSLTSIWQSESEIHGILGFVDSFPILRRFSGMSSPEAWPSAEYVYMYMYMRICMRIYVVCMYACM